MLADHFALDPGSQIIRFQIDLRVSARAFLAWTLWLQGFPDQAIRAAKSSIEDARTINHAISLCYVLAQAACPIALLVCDLAAAEHDIRMLLDYSTSHALANWHAFGRSYQGLLEIKRGDVVTGLRMLRASLDEVGEVRFAMLRSIPLLTAEALGRAGQIAEGLAEVEQAVAQSEQTEDHWQIAELLRIKGELRLLEGAPGAAAAAEDHFRQALDWARRQDALSWELRAATSLARLWCDQGRPTEAMALLQPVYDRFTEGFDTADLEAAKGVLDTLAEPNAPPIQNS